MTIITYRNGVMASDSAMSFGSIITADCQKIFRLDSGALWGSAGLADDRELREILSERGPDISYDDLLDAGFGEDMQGLLVMPDKSIYILTINAADSNNKKTIPEIIPVTAEYIAVGQGDAIALGAFAVGATAPRAVEAAIKHAGSLRGPVQTMKLKG